MSLLVDTFGTEKVEVSKIETAVKEIFDMKPKSIIDRLDLLRPIYSPTAAYGHFGRDLDGYFPWEELTFVEKLKDLCH